MMKGWRGGRVERKMKVGDNEDREVRLREKNILPPLLLLHTYVLMGHLRCFVGSERMRGKKKKEEKRK